MFEAYATHCGKESIESLRIVESGGMYTREETNFVFYTLSANQSIPFGEVPRQAVLQLPIPPGVSR